MERFFSITVAAIALTAVAVASLHTPIANAAGPATTGVALQYEEISRFAIAPATPPPPGAFQDDRAAIMSSGHHGGIFAAIKNAMNMLHTGTLTRYTYYNNWVRTDDVVGATATIVKCDLHQYISLDLGRHTYKITSTVPSPEPQAAPGAPGPPVVQNSRPGTVDVTVTMTHTNLGPRTLENVPTQGSSSAVTLAMTNATGSCSNASTSMQMVEYISGIGIPRPYCPLPVVSGAAPSSPQQYITHGGCVPHFHGSISGMSGMMSTMGSSGDKLAMYRQMSMGGAQANGQNFKTVTEDGNVSWLSKSQADALFSIPPGFTQQQ